MPTSSRAAPTASLPDGGARRLAMPAASAGTLGSAPGPFASVALAVAVTGIPIALHLIGQAAGIAACVALALLVACFAAPAAPIVLISS